MSEKIYIEEEEEDISDSQQEICNSDDDPTFDIIQSNFSNLSIKKKSRSR